MKIRVNDKLQRSLTKTYWRKARKALAQTTAGIIEMSREMQPEALRMMVNGTKSNEYIRTYIIELWGNVGNQFAKDIQDRIFNRKDEILWEEMFRNYMFERSLLKANSILNTQQMEINRIIDIVLNEGERLGWGIEQISEEVTRQLKRDFTVIQNYHAERIARTEVIGASNRGSYESALFSGVNMRKAWLTSGLKGIRDSHLYYESLGYMPMDYSYNTGLKFPGDPTGAPEEIINCYIGDTEIKSYIVGAQRSYYSGKMIEIITIGGKRLTVTPNHNILTKNGFVKACELTNLHDLVCHVEQTKGLMSKISNYINKKKTLAAKVFSTVSKFWLVEKVEIAALDFNGDGRFMDKDVNIVDANRELLINSVMFFKDRGKFWFKKSRAQRFLIESFCSFHFGFNRVLCATNSIMSFLHLAFSLGKRHFRPFEFCSIGSPPDIDTSIFKMTSEGYSHDTGFVTELFETYSSLISFDKVRKIRDFDFSGHVYDFTSLTGTNIANNIYTSNCRCTIVYDVD